MTRALSPDLLSNALAALRRSFDPTHGGFGTAPKFPHALELRLLLRLARALRRPDRAAHGPAHAREDGPRRHVRPARRRLPPLQRRREVARPALREDALRQRPAHRRPTSRRARRPRDPFYEQIARETLDYVLREMTAPGGAFFSHAGRRQRGRGGQVLRLEREGNPRRARPGAGRVRVQGVRRDRTRQLRGAQHPLPHADRRGRREGARPVASRTSGRSSTEAKRKLYEVRSKRVWPGRDEKILTAWNGLMIAAFAQAGAAFGETEYIELPRRGRGLRPRTPARRPTAGCSAPRGVGQPPKLNGYLEDYAFLADALVYALRGDVRAEVRSGPRPNSPTRC